MRFLIPLVIGVDDNAIGTALREEDGRIVLVNFNHPYDMLYGHTGLSAFEFKYLEVPAPHVKMVLRDGTPFKRVPVIVESTDGGLPWCAGSARVRPDGSVSHITCGPDSNALMRLNFVSDHDFRYDAEKLDVVVATRRNLPTSDIDKVLEKAATVLEEQFSFDPRLASEIISILVLSGFVIRKVTQDAQVPAPAKG